MNVNKKDFWTGIAIGGAIGLGGGLVIGCTTTRKSERKKYESSLSDERHKAYIRGLNDGEAEAKKWIDENVVIVDASDPQAAQKAIEKAAASKDSTSDDTRSLSKDIDDKNVDAKIPDSKALKEADPSQSEASDFSGPENGKFEGVKSGKITYYMDKNFLIHNQYVIFKGAGGTELYYPKALILDEVSGDLYDDLRMRANILDYEKDKQKLRVIWNAMGWGSYIPDLNGEPCDEDIDDWNVDIGDEPEVKTEERRKYLEELKKYKENPEAAKPHIITREEYEEENYLEHEMYDYYPVDNVFVKNDEINSPTDDAFNLFGTSNGHELFDRDLATDDDPDIVFIKNPHMGVVAEITRYPGKSYASVKDGTAYV